MIAVTMITVHTPKARVGFPGYLEDWPDSVQSNIRTFKRFKGPCPCCGKKLVIRFRGDPITQGEKDYLSE